MQHQKKAAVNVVEEDSDCDPSAHEEVPDDVKAGISIKNITKIYSQV